MTIEFLFGRSRFNWYCRGCTETLPKFSGTQPVKRKQGERRPAMTVGHKPAYPSQGCRFSWLTPDLGQRYPQHWGKRTTRNTEST